MMACADGGRQQDKPQLIYPRLAVLSVESRLLQASPLCHTMDLEPLLQGFLRYVHRPQIMVK